MRNISMPKKGEKIIKNYGGKRLSSHEKDA